MRIEILDEAAKNGTKYQDINVNPTFGAAYFYSQTAGNRLINFGEVIWERDIEEILENCRRFGIKDFTISSTYSGLLTTLAEFEKHSCHMVRLIEINSNIDDWKAGLEGESKKEIIPALLMRLDRE
ncbi:DUF7698 family protein [Butyrivibrio sp. MB2005]|uniref:DUF7698 family protein n=1 Tax=Butyrivibrio sp. MB2005 TaxID=1280678 RepID=UPI0004162B2E|nr:hypothetical protein [Butyrivibrio sp. MB2005]